MMYFVVLAWNVLLKKRFVDVLISVLKFQGLSLGCIVWLKQHFYCLLALSDSQYMFCYQVVDAGGHFRLKGDVDMSKPLPYPRPG